MKSPVIHSTTVSLSPPDPAWTTHGPIAEIEGLNFTEFSDYQYRNTTYQPNAKEVQHTQDFERKILNWRKKIIQSKISTASTIEQVHQTIADTGCDVIYIDSQHGPYTERVGRRQRPIFLGISGQSQFNPPVE